MGIKVGGGGSSLPPVLKRTAIGQHFVGLLVDAEQRGILDDKNQPKLNAKGKPAQEMVLTLLTIESTEPAGLSDTVAIPEPGSVVRMILRGKMFGEWIEQTKEGAEVGYRISHRTDSAVTYDQTGAAKATLHTQAEVDAVPRSVTLGIYGPLTVEPNPDTAQVAEAEAAYEAKHAEPAAAEPAPRQGIMVGQTPDYTDEEPF